MKQTELRTNPNVILLSVLSLVTGGRKRQSASLCSLHGPETFRYNLHYKHIIIVIIVIYSITLSLSMVLKCLNTD